MWFTMHQTMSWSEHKLWSRVPLSKLMLHHSSSGTYSTMELKSAARRRLLPRRKERKSLRQLLLKR
ncbi:hypothetical protein SASPL_130479 [Salvia splendens]|uniref:Uncharacterized protein n=1 Tax=Salvia splendens TaxID=180675 RepID=A0A8X8ZK24_SALSN|nr:hypothetical protein SASPL_130479 [Salvia splendens]